MIDQRGESLMVRLFARWPCSVQYLEARTPRHVRQTPTFADSRRMIYRRERMRESPEQPDAAPTDAERIARRIRDYLEGALPGLEREIETLDARTPLYDVIGSFSLIELAEFVSVPARGSVGAVDLGERLARPRPPVDESRAAVAAALRGMNAVDLLTATGGFDPAAPSYMLAAAADILDDEGWRPGDGAEAAQQAGRAVSRGARHVCAGPYRRAAPPTTAERAASRTA